HVTHKNDGIVHAHSKPPFWTTGNDRPRCRGSSSSTPKCRDAPQSGAAFGTVAGCCRQPPASSSLNNYFIGELWEHMPRFPAAVHGNDGREDAHRLFLRRFETNPPAPFHHEQQAVFIADRCELVARAFVQLHARHFSKLRGGRGDIVDDKGNFA